MLKSPPHIQTPSASSTFTSKSDLKNSLLLLSDGANIFIKVTVSFSVLPFAMRYLPPPFLLFLYIFKFHLISYKNNNPLSVTLYIWVIISILKTISFQFLMFLAGEMSSCKKITRTFSFFKSAITLDLLIEFSNPFTLKDISFTSSSCILTKRKILHHYAPTA